MTGVQTCALPIFLPLIGAGVTAENIHDSAAFLVGACSCEVKEQNPGFDLLLAADWDVLLSQDGVPLLASETRKIAPTGTAELVPIPGGSPVLIEEESHFTANARDDLVTWLVVATVVGGALVIIRLLSRR